MKVLIVTYRRAELLRRCIDQLRMYFGPADLLIVDNHSDESDAIVEYCSASGIAVLRNATNEGFARAVNRGMRQLVSDGATWVLLINTDAELLINPKDMIRSVGSRWACITTFDGAATLPWDCEKPIPNPWRAAWEDAGLGRVRIPQPLGSRYRKFSDRHRGYLVGCFLLVSTAAWKMIGEFDERFWLYSEETDWCRRAYAAGMDCKVLPIIGYQHEARQSSVGNAVATQQSSEAYRTSRILFLEKHWGSAGAKAYRLFLAWLTDLRKIAGAARRLSRGSR